MLRDAMQELADKISRSHQLRREFLAQSKRATQKILTTANQDRRVMARETQREATDLVESLKATNRKIKSTVAKELREIKSHRISSKSQQRLSAMQSVARNRRAVHRLLTENTQHRKIVSRQTERDTVKTIRNIRMQVLKIRTVSRSLTTRISNDIQASRRIWSRLRAATSVS